MIPIKLSIQGLFSYQKKQVIDFNPLISSQVFGVFGGVGSGKSSILDAITFALYGELDRLGLRDGRAYNMMNLKSDELLIDFEFKTGVNEEKYRFITTAKRNSKRFEEVKSFVRKAYHWQDKWIPLEHENAEKIIGISYQNFRRTVIIPQGKFQEFLQLGTSARSQMLKEIFNLRKYDLSFKTGHLQKINDTKIASLDGEISHYADITLETLHEKEKRLDSIVSQNDQLRKSYEQLDKELLILKELQKLFEQKEALSIEYKSLQAKEVSYKIIAENIKLTSLCLIEFKPLLDQKTILKTKLSNSTHSLQNLKTTLKDNQNRVLAKQKSLADAKKIVDQKLKIHTEINEIHKIIEIKRTQDSITEQKKRLDKGNELIQTIKNNLRDDIKKELKLKTSLKTLKKDKPDYKALATIDSWYKDKQKILLQENEIEKSITEEKTSLKRLKTTFSSAYNNINDLPKIDIETIEEDLIFSFFNTEKERLLLEIKSNDSKSLKLQTQLQLEALAHTLEDGESCPLCGSLEHPSKLTSHNINDDIKLLEHNTAQLRTRQESIQNIKNKYEQYQFQYTEKQKRLTQLASKLNIILEEQSNHKKAFIWETYDPEDQSSFSAAYQNANELEKTIENKEKNIDSIQTEIDEQQNDLEKYQNALKKIEYEYTTHLSTKDTLLEQITELDIQEYQDKSSATLTTIAKEWSNNIKLAEKNYLTLDKEVDTLNTQIGQLHGQIIEEEKQYHELKNENETIVKSITTKLSTSSIIDLKQVQKLLSNAALIDQQKQELQSYKTSLHSTEKQLLKLENETKNVPYDSKEYDKKEQQSKVLLMEIKKLQEQVGSIKKEIESLTKGLKNKSRIQQELKALNIRKENIKTLKGMFKGNGFVDYISSVYLEQLCNSANARFYNLTKHQLKLELTEKNDFKVIDYMNDAKERSVKTLSGGQTFQASLSLALALAESVQHQSKSKQNFFFLDEGFGTQDNDALQIVFDTIKSLRKENRIVGIISHLEKLQDEIDVYIHIEKDDELGSLIKTSY